MLNGVENNRGQEQGTYDASPSLILTFSVNGEPSGTGPSPLIATLRLIASTAAGERSFAMICLVRNVTPPQREGIRLT